MLGGAGDGPGSEGWIVKLTGSPSGGSTRDQHLPAGQEDRRIGSAGGAHRTKRGDSGKRDRDANEGAEISTAAATFGDDVSSLANSLTLLWALGAGAGPTVAPARESAVDAILIETAYSDEAPKVPDLELPEGFPAKLSHQQLPEIAPGKYGWIGGFCDEPASRDVMAILKHEWPGATRRQVQGRSARCPKPKPTALLGWRLVDLAGEDWFVVETSKPSESPVETARLLIAQIKDAFWLGLALVPAIQSQNGLLLQMLLKAGADVNARYSPRDVTPLIAAATLGKVEYARALLDVGAAVDVRPEGGEDDHSHSAVGMAVANCDVPMAELLFSRGARADRDDLHGCEYQAKHPDAAKIKAIVEKAIARARPK